MIDKVAVAAGRAVSRETFERLQVYVATLLDESERQNLIATSTAEHVWERHILDCAQLLRWLPEGGAVDLGSGAGLPGIVLAILTSGPFTLVEPRRLRAEFLARCVNQLELDNVTVVPRKSETVVGSFAAITARVVAALDKLFAAAHHLSHPETIWVLPKGRSGKTELAAARSAWQGRFRIEQSVTEPDAVIVIATQLAARRRGRG